MNVISNELAIGTGPGAIHVAAIDGCERHVQLGRPKAVRVDSAEGEGMN
jgi:hypothetical protein